MAEKNLFGESLGGGAAGQISQNVNDPLGIGSWSSGGGENTTEKRFRRAMGEIFPLISGVGHKNLMELFRLSENVPEVIPPARQAYTSILRDFFPQVASDLSSGTTDFTPTWNADQAIGNRFTPTWNADQAIGMGSTPARTYVPAMFQNPGRDSVPIPSRTSPPKFSTTPTGKAPIQQASPTRTGYEGQGFVGGRYSAAPTWTDPQYTGTRAITPEVVNSREFQAFESDLNKSVGRQSAGIADEMARRGILSSGATGDAYGQLGESAQKAVSGEIARLSGPLIRESLIEQAINEPKRRTEFDVAQNLARMGYGAGEAERRTSFDVGQGAAGTDFGRWLSELTTQTGESGASRADDYSKWLGGTRQAEAGRADQYSLDLARIRQQEAEREQTAKRDYMNRILGIAGTEGGLEKSYQDELRQLPLEEFTTKSAALTTPISALMSIITGGAGPLSTMMDIRQAATQAAQNREDARRNNMISIGATVLGSMFGGPAGGAAGAAAGSALANRKSF